MTDGGSDPTSTPAPRLLHRYRAAVGSAVFELRQGDITDQPDLDAIANAANAALRPGGGVAGAIHRAAGPRLAEVAVPLGPIRPGQCVVTDAFDLPNRAVLHCLGPVYGQDEPAGKLLASCYRQALRLAAEQDLQTVGFPALSTGIFGYPIDEAAEVAITTILDEMRDEPRLELVCMVLFSAKDLAAHERHLAHLVEPAGA